MWTEDLISWRSGFTAWLIRLEVDAMAFWQCNVNWKFGASNSALVFMQLDTLIVDTA